MKHVDILPIQAGGWSAHKISEDWDESSVNWENKPSYGSALSLCEVEDNWLHFDVTSAVQEFVEDPTTNFGIAIYTVINMQNSYIASSEYSDETLRPKLTVEYSGGVPVSQPFSAIGKTGFSVKVTDDALVMNCDVKGNSNLVITNLQGREILNTKVNSVENGITLPIKLSKGIHIVKLKTPDNSFVKRINVVK